MATIGATDFTIFTSRTSFINIWSSKWALLYSCGLPEVSGFLRALRPPWFHPCHLHQGISGSSGSTKIAISTCTCELVAIQLSRHDSTSANQRPNPVAGHLVSTVIRFLPGVPPLSCGENELHGRPQSIHTRSQPQARPVQLEELWNLRGKVSTVA